MSEKYCNEYFCVNNSQTDCSGEYCYFLKNVISKAGIKNTEFRYCSPPLTLEQDVWDNCLQDITQAQEQDDTKGYMGAIPFYVTYNRIQEYQVNYSYPLFINTMWFSTRITKEDSWFLIFKPFELEAWYMFIALSTLGGLMFYAVENKWSFSAPWGTIIYAIYTHWIMSIRSLLRSGQLGPPIKTVAGRIIALTNAIYVLGFTTMYVSNLTSYILKNQPRYVYKTPLDMGEVYKYREINMRTDYYLCVQNTLVETFKLKYSKKPNVQIMGIDMDAISQEKLDKFCGGFMVGYNGFYDEQWKFNYNLCEYYKTDYSEFIVKLAYPISKKMGYTIDIAMMQIYEDGITQSFLTNTYGSLPKCNTLDEAKNPALSIYDGKSLFAFVTIFYLVMFVIMVLNYMRNGYSYKLDSKTEERLLIRQKINEKVKELFDSLDEDKSGELEKEEMRRLLEKLDPSMENDDLKFERYFKFIDKDGGGTVDFEEFFESFIYLRKKDLRKEQDKSGDNTI